MVARSDLRPRPRVRIAVWLWAGVVLFGCVDGPGRIALPAAEVEAFAVMAQPILAERCANPSCHGDSARPLALFAVHRHRIDPMDVFLDAPLTDEELRLNLYRTLGFVSATGEPAQSVLLTKPLAISAGGVHHRGGTQFAGRESHDFIRLLQWANEAVDSTGTPEARPD